MPDDDRQDIPVWDPFIRLFHWSLAASFLVAYLTEDDFLGLHVWSGYVAGILIVLRLPWGFVGPRHARFSNFVRRPAESIAYMRQLLALRAPRHLGHSPAAGAMIVVLMVAVTLTVLSGLALYGAGEKAGPMAGLFPASAVDDTVGGHAASQRQKGADHDDDDDDDDEDDDDRSDEQRGGDEWRVDGDYEDEGEDDDD
ncbi:MAG: cytochrome b/b6 domain-containing protein, partial [Rhodospirillales bacterium]|nr:cytochrome b/b6 domain-containing protein [Rhodospirillales bacterium]